MQVSLYDKDTLIGLADLTVLDPPMGVATGAFVPSENYSRSEHANVIDDDYIGDRSQHFRVVSGTHGEIESSAIAILDYPALGEIELHVLGITRPEYAIIFGNYPDYRAYYGLDLPVEERLAQDEVARSSLRARDARAWLWLLAILAGMALVLFWIS